MKMIPIDCTDFLGTTSDGRPVNLHEFESSLAMNWHVMGNNVRLGISCANYMEPLDFSGAYAKEVNKIPFNYAINATDDGALRDFGHKWNRFSLDRKSRWLANYYPQYKKFMARKLYLSSMAKLDIWQ